jgi:hypothetical protein
MKDIKVIHICFVLVGIGLATGYPKDSQPQDYTVLRPGGFLPARLT